MQEVFIVDSGGANLASLQFALERLGAAARITSDASEVARATRVILPGVGSAPHAMQRLRACGLTAVLPALRCPVLGICLGMQLLFESSDEGPTQCLGVLPGAVRRLQAAHARPVPHMGWNEVWQLAPHPLWKGIADGSRFYFVHSYYCEPTEEALAAASTRYPDAFTSAIARDNIFATQFHPEKGSAAGLALLRNFAIWDP